MTFKKNYSKRMKDKNKRPLTDEGWLVLKLFIIREGLAQLHFSRYGNRQNSKNVYQPPDHFYSYSRDIEHQLFKKISHQTAINWCKRFKEIGLFESIDRRTENRAYQKNQQYFLKSDLETFKQIVDIVIQQCKPLERLEILSTQYFQSKIDEKLVRKILSTKNVSILASIDAFDWSPEEFPYIFADLKGINVEEVIPDMTEKFQSQIRELEQNNRKKWNFSPAGQIIIPILPNSSEEEDISLFNNALNKPSLNDDPIIPVTRYHSILKDYRQITEYENLILPILCLIKISPEALNEFINGTWDDFRMNLGLFSKPDEEKHYYFFINLFMIAMNDIACTLKIPSNGLVRSANLRGMPEEFLVSGEVQKEDALFKIDLYSFQRLYFDMGYSTKGIEQNNTSVFSNNNIIKDSPKESDYWMKIWIKEKRGALIVPEEIKDDSLLLKHLRDSSRKEITHIRSLLSNRFRNILQIYPNIDNPGKYMKKTLVKELNRILQHEDFYDTEVMKDLPLREILRECLEEVHDYKQKEDVYFAGIYLEEQIHNNRELLDCILTEYLYEYGEIRVPKDAIMKHVENKMNMI